MNRKQVKFLEKITQARFAAAGYGVLKAIKKGDRFSLENLKTVFTAKSDAIACGQGYFRVPVLERDEDVNQSGMLPVKVL